MTPLKEDGNSCLNDLNTIESVITYALKNGQSIFPLSPASIKYVTD